MAVKNRDVKSLVGSLLDMQVRFSKYTSSSATGHLERAAILYELGFSQAAMADAERALSIDPSDPKALALQCIISAAANLKKDKHCQALALLQSPFASTMERKLALPAVDPSQLPVLLRLALPHYERLTVMTRPSDVVQFSGNETQDEIEYFANATEGTIHAIDFWVKRHTTGPRILTVTLNDTQHVVDVLALTPPALALPRPGAGESASIWVIMPLKDGGPALLDAVDSLLADIETILDARVILVDDGSTETETLELLKSADKHKNVRVVRSTQQLGFTAAVNLGLRHVGSGPVLLLNSDVWVPRNSLSRLLAHLDDDDIGTVTPLSNNAGSFSLLGHNRPFPMPDQQMCERLAETALAVNKNVVVDMPSGNGFAMLISEACLHAVGSFSGVYDSGYYEEVDFCLRAAMRGWRNVAATDCFIGHVGSVTYGAQKQHLVAANLRRLLQNFPAYARTYAAFDALDPLSGPRARILQAVAEGAFSASVAPVTGPEITVTLRSESTTTVLLPCTDTVPAELLKIQFRSLRLCRQTLLSAAGLTVDPGHQLYLTPEGSMGNVSLYDGAGLTPILHFKCSDADDEDFATFETTVLNLHAHRQAFGATHAISV